MFSSPAPGRDSHLSFPIISSGSGGGERQREPNYPPQCQAPSTWGSQVPPHLLPHRLRRCRSLPAPGQPSTDCATAATGKATGVGMVEGKGMQLSAWAKPKQNDRGRKKAAFIQLNHSSPLRSPRGALKHVFPQGWGWLQRWGGSQQLRRCRCHLLPFPARSSDGRKRHENAAWTPGVRVPLGADVSLSHSMAN